LSFRARARNPVWMLRFAQHDKSDSVIPNALFCHSERERGIQYGCFASLSMTKATVSFRTLFFVIPSAVRNPVHGCFASFSMTSAVSFRALFFVIPSAVRNPVHGCFAPFSMTSAVSFRALFFVIPSESEESSAWMLHCAYAPFSMTRWCHSERSFLSFRARARNPVWMLRFAQHDKSDSVIPNALFCHSERMRGIPCMDASLRPAPQGSHVEYFCYLHSILIINTT